MTGWWKWKISWKYKHQLGKWKDYFPPSSHYVSHESQYQLEAWALLAGLEEPTQLFVPVEQVVLVALDFLPWKHLEALAMDQQLVVIVPIPVPIQEPVESSASQAETQTLMFVLVFTS